MMEARCFKWEFASDLTSSMGNDFHIFRLADIYLMKAEALLRGGEVLVKLPLW
ncbi:MAG: RagB/SusD family nutrient uptake outer membrane protein [Parabacteroides distasonis]